MSEENAIIKIKTQKTDLAKIDLYSIIDVIIESNKSVYEWYLQNILHENNYSIEVTINGEAEEVILSPEYEKIELEIIEKKKPVKIEETAEIEKKRYLGVLGSVLLNNYDSDNYDRVKPAQDHMIINAKKYDLSCSKLEIVFFNSGDTALEYYKIFFTISDARVKFCEKNYESIGIMGDLDICYPKGYFVHDNTIMGTSKNFSF